MVLPQAGVNLVAETDQYEKGIRKAVRESDKADRAFADLVQAANRLERALDIDGDVKVKVDDSEIDDVESRLEKLQKLATIEVALSVASFALPAIGGIVGAITGPIQDLIDIDRVLGQVEARTGGMLPNARELISDLWVNGWGESREELGQVVTKLAQLGIEQDKIGASATAVLATSQIMGAEIGEILRTTSSLITNDLAPDIEAATDLIIRGLQETGDPAEDLLDTLNEYSSTFKGLGIDGQLAISILDSALEDAFFDTDKAADALREFRIRVSEIDNNDTNQTLDKLGLLDDRLEFMADPGQFGPRFLSDVIENIAAIEDPAQRAFATTALFGTQLEDLGPTALASLDPLNLFNGLIKDIPGATATASSAINNNLGQSILELKRVVSEGLLVALDETFDISGKIDTAKGKIQEFAAVLKSGEGFGEALSIVFGIEGFDVQIEQLQSTFIGFSADFLGGLATLLDALGKIPGIDASGDVVRGAARLLGARALVLELRGAESVEDIRQAGGRATGRGVGFDPGGKGSGGSGGSVADIINSTIRQLIKDEDFGAALRLAKLAERGFGGATGTLPPAPRPLFPILGEEEIRQRVVVEAVSIIDEETQALLDDLLLAAGLGVGGPELRAQLDLSEIVTDADLAAEALRSTTEQTEALKTSTSGFRPTAEDFRNREIRRLEDIEKAAQALRDAEGEVVLDDSPAMVVARLEAIEKAAQDLTKSELALTEVTTDTGIAEQAMEDFREGMLGTIDGVAVGSEVMGTAIRTWSNDGQGDIFDVQEAYDIFGRNIENISIATIKWVDRQAFAFRQLGRAFDDPSVQSALNVNAGGGNTTTTTTTGDTNSNNTTNINVENPPAPVDPLAEGVAGAPSGP